MIQRIQTVYLFFAFCLMAILAFIPVSSLNAFSNGFFIGFSSVIALVAIITVFLYKNRRTQIGLCYGMLIALVLFYIFYFIFNRQNLSFTELFKQVQYTFVFPFISIIFVYLALRGIKKDEKLVRSLDRLR